MVPVPFCRATDSEFSTPHRVRASRSAVGRFPFEWYACVPGPSPIAWSRSSTFPSTVGASVARTRDGLPGTTGLPTGRVLADCPTRRLLSLAVLEELRITGLGVIEDTTLPLTTGMNVITGETGAGKTMVVTGLGLLFGGRADAARVRAAPGRATVDGRVRLARDTAAAVQERVIEAGAEVDSDGSLLLSRTVTAEGRSRAHIGGRTVPVSVLGEVGE